MSETYQDFHARSINDMEGFWAEQAQLIDWKEPFTQTLEFDNPPFRRWFVNGKTNLCHNAVDRHLKDRANQNAMIHISTETGAEKAYSYQELYEEVCRMAAIFKKLGVKKGDRVLIYMPMIPEAIFAMLATVRLGAVHSVVFGGFASHSLATRIEDASPTLIVSADAGMRGGKTIAYKPLLDKAIELSSHKPEKVLLVNRELADMDIVQMRDVDYAALRSKVMDERPECEWVESNEPSYILYTSGTTGKPKGVQRDTGGYTVALASSMKYIYCGNPGETFFCTSDIGWVVGHSYIVYAPLIAGMATVVYEGLPTRPDAGIWWQIVEKYKVSVMFSAPTALRVLKKQDPAYLKKYDVSSLRALYLAGEPLDEPTSSWINQELGIDVIDNYWQTETGWAILSAMPGIEKKPLKNGSPSFPVYGYNVKILNEGTGEEAPAGEKGVLVILPPMPPGNLSTIWQQDQRFVDTYFSDFGGKQLAYSTSDWGVRDEDGYYFILGRTDDVINVAGHRLGTREIEEAVSGHSAIAEVAVVGVNDALKGQVPIAFAVVKNPDDLNDPERREALAKEVISKVSSELGAIANPSQVHFVSQLPKTRSGKVLRRSIQAIAEGRDPGDLATLDDIAGIEQIRSAVSS